MGDSSLPHEGPTGLPGSIPTQPTNAGYQYPELDLELQNLHPYRILDQYHSKPRKLRIASAGAGASGLCLAYKAERMLEAGTWELTLFDKNSHFGGTWWENTYPGVACDVPAHIYTYTFEPKTDWSAFFAGGAEIQKYFEDFADKYGLRKYMKLNTKVIEARWIDEEAIWKITLEDQVTKDKWEDWSHIFVNGTGILNNWQWPDLEGREEFEGPVMHTAHWNHDVDLTGKVVGLIGTGSSSVQVLPNIQPICKEVQVYIRSPTWISPPISELFDSDVEKSRNPPKGPQVYTEEEKKRFKEDPEYHLKYRQKMEAELNGFFFAFKQGSQANNLFRKVITESMLRRIGPGHEKLKKHIFPTFSPGCRRLSPGEGYLEALVKPNVKHIYDSIVKITPKGLLTADGTEHKMDVLICATGFKVAFKPAFRVVNGQGKSIQDDWDEGVNMYFGLSAPSWANIYYRFPNYFAVVGPGSTWGNGALIPSIETSIEYILKVAKRMQTELITSLCAKQEAVDQIFAHMDEMHKDTVWQEECRSWWKDGKIKNRIYIWPGSAIHFLKTIREPRFEDYLIKYRYGNRYAYLGNGIVKANTTGSVEDLSPYIRNGDYDWEID